MNIDERFNKHLSGAGAKYTKSHIPYRIEAVWRSKNKSLACKLEYQLKHLTKQQKENIIQGKKLTAYLKGKIDGRRYYKISTPKVENEYRVIGARNADICK